MERRADTGLEEKLNFTLRKSMNMTSCSQKL
jgi:hypothetical protein